MSDKLKKFVTENRQEFDSQEPGNDVWKKIESKAKGKNSSWISSSWLSKYKYLGFSLSVLIVAVYFVTNYSNVSSVQEIIVNKKDSVVVNSEQDLKPELNTGTLNETQNTSSVTLANNVHQRLSSKYNRALNNQKDSNLKTRPSETDISEREDTGPNDLVDSLSTTTNLNNKKNIKSKKTIIYIPEEPTEVNSYSGTLYDGSSLCSLLRVYRFPGKVSAYDDRSTGKNYKVNLKTISCSRLGNIAGITAVWLKGKTDKKITLSIKEKFTNILLVKSDGRKFSPEAISHYYPGQGVISEYTGKYFNMVFKDQVGLILFFKNAEEGDKIIIEGIPATIIKNKP